MSEEKKTETEEGQAKKATMTSEDLRKFIVDTMSENLQKHVEDAVAPLKAQVTDYGANVIGSKDTKRKPSPEEKGIGFARMVRALGASRGDPERAARWCQRAFNDDLGDVVTKALAAGDLTAGGFMVPEDMEQDIIPLLRNRTVMRAAGTPTVPMPRGTLTMPRQTGDITANYVGENKDITSSEPTGDQIVLSAKKLAAITPISNDLLQYDVGTQADEFVRNSMVRQMSVREDLAFIRNDGTAGQPKGLRFWAQSANVTSSNGTSATNIESDFKDLIQDLEGNNVDMTRPIWVMAPRSKNHLITLRDANGNLIYPELRSANPTIHQFPVFVTNQIPTNLGGGSDETEVYLVNVPDTMIAEAGGLEITVDDSASYLESGSLVSSFVRDQTAIRAISRHDFAVLHPESVAVKNAITWGA